MLAAFAGNLGELLGRLRHHEEGQGLAEYALILLFIAVVCIAALVFLGTSISSLLSNIGTSL